MFPFVVEARTLNSAEAGSDTVIPPLVVASSSSPFQPAFPMVTSTCPFVVRPGGPFARRNIHAAVGGIGFHNAVSNREHECLHLSSLLFKNHAARHFRGKSYLSARIVPKAAGLESTPPDGTARVLPPAHIRRKW